MTLCVIDTDAEVAGAPGAPLDVFCQEANKDYVIVTWKQPAVDGGSSILGYFVDRCIFLNLFLKMEIKKEYTLNKLYVNFHYGTLF